MDGFLKSSNNNTVTILNLFVNLPSFTLSAYACSKIEKVKELMGLQ